MAVTDDTPPANWHINFDIDAMNAVPAHLQRFLETNESLYISATLPVVVGADEQWLLTAYCEHSGYRERDPTDIYAPRVLQWIHYPSGEFRWEEPAPNAYGLATAVQDDFGLCLGPIERDHLPGNTWHEASLAYFPLVRRVIERRWLVTAYPPTAEERETARALQACVAAYFDKPLLPFYQHHGTRFFAWLARAAQ